MAAHKPIDICAAARSYLGTPWRRMGCDRNGMDCLGLVRAAHHDCYGTTVEVAPHAKTVSVAELVHGLSQHLKAVARHQMASGDVLVFALDTSALAHCAIFDATRFTIIHANATQRCVVEQAFSSLWRDRVVAVFRSLT